MTKHLSTLVYHFPSLHTSFDLAQTDTSNSTGSSLWLSSQVLASHLISLSFRHSGTIAAAQQDQQGRDGRRGRRTAIELGSGTGLLSLLLARLGWHVIATDIQPVLSTVLRRNTRTARFLPAMATSGGKLEVRQLDWTCPPHDWDWSRRGNIAGPPNHGGGGVDQYQDQHLDDEDDYADVTRTLRATEGTTPDFDLILTADTVYEPSLVRPLIRALSHLYRSHSAFDRPHTHEQQEHGRRATRSPSRPHILLALERRDGATIDAALAVARDEFGLDFQRIPHRKVKKTFDSHGDGRSWRRDDWLGVEIWQL
ncbi:uncharacterized protein PFL1_06009 [Pseudozyma flocculosa PF-1]|uniref:Uncharacterized protein n=1 Tax=Pseudozyma flocculosa PF-1 TaxID=1277687 RepID=A0A061H6Z2_9BASI|nr:uncharacterized protein PFL1_06009 [Pseudozyma flocculosa PF-1]EPQ26361.1 hypothetical protein PFL1_06009 [Pseudozyma flocculosa PF-1]